MFCKIGNKLLVLYNVLAGYCIKWKTDIFGPGKLYPLERKNEGENIIVSLTSYGRRVQKTVYYTLVSLLKQTLPANRIILWLSADNWSDETLPKRLKKLKEYGVEYGFCKDLRSYTKLIPSLKAAPKDLIVTVDDDMIYSRILLQTLYKEHKKYPDCICCMEALMPAHSDKSSFCRTETGKRQNIATQKKTGCYFLWVWAVCFILRELCIKMFFLKIVLRNSAPLPTIFGSGLWQGNKERPVDLYLKRLKNILSMPYTSSFTRTPP